MTVHATPLVYCETNWLVAAAIPHHQHHAKAHALLEAARAGACHLFLPAAAALEAPHPIREVARRFSQDVARLRDDLARAARNGEGDLQAIARALTTAAEVDRYAGQSAVARLDALLGVPEIQILDDVPATLQAMDTLRPRARFAGKDIVDLYLLGAIIAHRRTTPLSTPAILFSLNREEFQAREHGALPPDFYGQDRLVWRDDFDLASAVRAWQACYAPG